MVLADDLVDPIGSESIGQRPWRLGFE
ncbi:hypothetical protein BAL199_29615 [alpha proteobacterium BAL199]|nr:hypothetical protein BAL199_29615 [alpha proteobacterium BAL199]